MKRMNGKRGLLRAVALGSVLLLVVAGCKSPSGKGVNDVVIRQALVGKDGARTVNATNTIVNTYSALAANANAGTGSVTVAAISDLATDLGTDGGLQPLAVGDLLLIIQMAGATINDPNDPNDPTYGSVTSYNNAGNYELASVAGISANTITLGCALKNSYTLGGKAQVIRVPQYTTLTIAGAPTDAATDPNTPSITAPAWNGTVGGVVAVHAVTTLQLDGTIDVTGKGFRGGTAHDGAASGATDLLTYRSNLGTAGGQKGESIAGAPADYDNLFSGQYGRGAPANGGGGGNWHNGGGGGGANAAASGLTWNGQGVMLHSVANDATAWALDPGYTLSGGFANSPGGGRGGYTYSANDQDALTMAPGTVGPPNWGGNLRRERGGLGGHPLTSSPNGRLFLGGGGGAGDGNNGFPGPGGNGGGLVFVIAGTVAGGGSILANGAAGGAANSGTGASGDGAGGGGGGGTVVVHAVSLGQDVKIRANGGVGGTQQIAGVPEAEGPGGGGGGGYVALSGGTLTTVTANGGLGGTTDSPGLTEFPSNGATSGHAGITNGSAASILYCNDDVVAPDTQIVTKPANPTNVLAGAFTFTGTVGDAGTTDSTLTFECSLDTAAYASCPATYTPTVTEGSHTLSVRAKDLYANVDPTPATYTWVVDVTPPQTYILTGPADAGASATGHFTFSSDDTGELGVTYQCRLDSTNAADFVTCPADYTIEDLTDGSHTLDVRAKDAAGNVDATPATYTWEVHATGLDAGVEDAAADGEVIDGPAVVEDAGAAEGGVDTSPRLDSADGPGTVVLDARADVAAVDLAPSRDVPPIGTADAPADAATADAGGLEDASADGGGLPVDAPDAQVVVVVDARSSDAAAAPDQAVLPTPDAAVLTPDTAVPVPPGPDAPVMAGMQKIMGSGFCAVNPMRNSAPGPFTLFLVGVFGLLLLRRRR